MPNRLNKIQSFSLGAFHHNFKRKSKLPMSPVQAPEAAGDTQRYLDDDFEQWLEGLLEKHHVPGMSVAVVNFGEVEAAGYGLARLPDVTTSADTLYCMGSTTKAFTSALTGLLIQDEAKKHKKAADRKLKWSTPVAEILPEDFVTTDPYITKNTTIEDALSHRTGIAGHDLLWGASMGTASSITRSLRHLGPIIAPFRGKFQYNNMMYGVIGQVIEQHSGKSFPEILKELILAPLDMQSTYSGVKAASQSLNRDECLSFARGYYWVEDKAKSDDKVSASNVQQEKAGHFVPEAYIDLGAIGPAGNNISTVKDYAKWVQAFLTASKAPSDSKDESKSSATATSSQPSDQIIDHAIFRDLMTPRSLNLPVMAFFHDIVQHPPNPYVTPSTYALGWMTEPFIAPGEQIIEHGGGLPGFGAGVFLVPNHNFGVVAVGNTGMAANKLCQAVARELIGRKLGKSMEERRKHQPPEVKDVKAGESKDVPNAKPTESDTSPVSETFFNDKETDIVSYYTQSAYGTFSVSRGTEGTALEAQKPEMDGARIEREQKYDCATRHTTGKKLVAPLIIAPIPKRGLNYRLMMHNPRKAANGENLIIYGLEMLLCHGDLSEDPFSNLKQEFPDDTSLKAPLKNEIVWQSQNFDKKGAVVELDGNGLVKRLGLQLFRVDVPEKGDEEGLGEAELQDGWENRLVWFEKASVK